MLGRNRYLRYIEFFSFAPLAVFFAIVEYHPAKFPDRWAYAYYYTFAPATFFALAGLLNFPRSAKLWLGTNVWFSLLGMFALTRSWELLESIGMTFQESGGFVATACIGVVSSVIAPGSFVGRVGGTMADKRYSWVLAMISVILALISFSNQGNRVISVLLPVVVFVSVSRVIGHFLRREKYV